MLNEGLIHNDTMALVRSAIVDQIRKLGPTSPNQLERAVFKALVGHDRDEVDWDIEDNQAGYYIWLKSFDQRIDELIEDGHIRTDKRGTLIPTAAEPRSDKSPPAPPAAPAD